MSKEQLFYILEDLLQDCYNDLFEYENIEEEKAKLIYNNVKLFVAKLKDKTEEMISGDN